jgi:hypothetical protein
MNPIAIHRLKISIYTTMSLGVAWQTTMGGVVWTNMGWEEQSCLMAGIVVLWGQTMHAYFDKGATRASDFRNGVDSEKRAADSVKQ